MSNADGGLRELSPLGLTPRAERILINLTAGVGIFSGVVTTVASLANAFGLTPWSLVDSVIMLALAFGVLRRSRICAIALFALHVVERVWWLNRTGEVSFSVGFFPIAYAVIYLLGVFATVSHHTRGRTESVHS